MNERDPMDGEERVYTDGVHLVCADLDRLHAVARRLGLKRAWFQPGEEFRLPHYDLTTPAALHRALAAGVTAVTARSLVRWHRAQVTDGAVAELEMASWEVLKRYQMATVPAGFRRRYWARRKKA